MSSKRLIALILAASLLTAFQIVPAAAADPWPAGGVRVALSVDRLAGPDRFGTAVAIARAGWPGWVGVDHVIVASGETRAFSDPLAAGSLSWAYDAPLLLVSSSGVPASVRAALEEIRSVNSTVTVTIVGGTAAVPVGTVAQLKTIVGAANVEQPWTTGDRYALAAGIAARTSAVASDTARSVPARAMIANGTDAAGFVDALALSAVSARTGIPVLLTQRDRLPAATRGALDALPTGDVIVAGGTAVVSAAVYTASGAVARWAGPDRYATAIEVASGAAARGWLDGSGVGVAASVPDALAGATLSGRRGDPVIYTLGSSLSERAGRFLHAREADITSGTVYGGTAVVSSSVASELAGQPALPAFMNPPTGGYVAKKARVQVRTGVNTTTLSLYAGDTLVGTRTADSYSTVDFGVMPTPSDGVTYKVVASNPDATESARTTKYRRLSYPASTSIVIDKSDFRLYYVKGDVLVETYPIATGRPGMETPVALWKINAKYHTDPNGVYGPRKMRLFRKVGSSYVYTAYGIHGTNQPWVIGTKASHGCIRLYNSDILDLFPQVALGTLVQTRE